MESSTVFTYAGVRCRLLGVKEPESEEMRRKAKEFTAEWLDADGDGEILMFYNSDSPLNDEDGTCVVWAVCGRDARLLCLNVDLVASGLAEFDHADHPEYEFWVPTKESDRRANWRQALKTAREKRGTGIDSHEIEW